MKPDQIISGGRRGKHGKGMSSWRLPRPVVGAKRIRRGSSVGGSKPPRIQPKLVPASHHTLLLHTHPTPQEKSLSVVSLYTPKKNRRGNLVTARQGPRTSQRTGRIMSAPAAGEGKEKTACELCGAAARVYCGADKATLCWGCDAQVHSANFLVARHARALLCRGCARPTPWRAAGPRLGPTASLCDRCVRRDDVEMAGSGEEEDDDEEVVVEEEEGEGENQVVPWAEADATPPPVASSTSSSSREPAANGANAAECAKEDIPCSTSAVHGGRNDEATSSRNGGRFLVSRHRKRSPSDFLSSGSAQSGTASPARNCSNAGIGRNGFT